MFPSSPTTGEVQGRPRVSTLSHLNHFLLRRGISCQTKPPFRVRHVDFLRDVRGPLDDSGGVTRTDQTLHTRSWVLFWLKRSLTEIETQTWYRIKTVLLWKHSFLEVDFNLQKERVKNTGIICTNRSVSKEEEWYESQSYHHSDISPWCPSSDVKGVP